MSFIKVWNADRSGKKMVQAESLEDFKNKAAGKLGYPANSMPYKVVLESDGTEIDDDDIFLHTVKEKSIFILLQNHEEWKPIQIGNVESDVHGNTSPDKKFNFGSPSDKTDTSNAEVFIFSATQCEAQEETELESNCLPSSTCNNQDSQIASITSVTSNLTIGDVNVTQQKKYSWEKYYIGPPLNRTIGERSVKKDVKNTVGQNPQSANANDSIGFVVKEKKKDGSVETYNPGLLLLEKLDSAASLWKDKDTSSLDTNNTNKPQKGRGRGLLAVKETSDEIVKSRGRGRISSQPNKRMRGGSQPGGGTHTGLFANQKVISPPQRGAFSTQRGRGSFSMPRGYTSNTSKSDLNQKKNSGSFNSKKFASRDLTGMPPLLSYAKYNSDVEPCGYSSGSDSVSSSVTNSFPVYPHFQPGPQKKSFVGGASNFGYMDHKPNMKTANSQQVSGNKVPGTRSFHSRSQNRRPPAPPSGNNNSQAESTVTKSDEPDSNNPYVVPFKPWDILTNDLKEYCKIGVIPPQEKRHKLVRIIIRQLTEGGQKVTDDQLETVARAFVTEFPKSLEDRGVDGKKLGNGYTGLYSQLMVRLKKINNVSTN